MLRTRGSSTEDVAAAQPAQVRRTPSSDALRRHRRCVGQAAVRAAPVVMLDVASQDVSELLAADDQQLVGSRRALAKAVRTQGAGRRYTALTARLESGRARTAAAGSRP
jgi:hypothetical protein